MTARALIVGCGQPGRSMGWYHARNILEGNVEGVAGLVGIVEPFLSQHPTPEFQEFVEANDLKVYKSVSEYDGPLDDVFAVVATRTCEAPRMFSDLVAKGVRYIYLEKPGAPTVDEMEEMRKIARSGACEVTVGYARAASDFVVKPVAELQHLLLSSDFTDSDEDENSLLPVTLLHNNTFSEETLDECFARNSEGMFRNMACHELATAVVHLGLTLAHCEHAVLFREGTKMSVRGGNTDFEKVQFSVPVPERGIEVVFQEDRCGGDWAGIRVGTANTHYLPADREAFEKLCAQEPGTMRYLIQQKECYARYMAAFVREKVFDKVGEKGMGLTSAALSESSTPPKRNKFASSPASVSTVADIPDCSDHSVFGLGGPRQSTESDGGIRASVLCSLESAAEVLRIASYLTERWTSEMGFAQ